MLAREADLSHPSLLSARITYDITHIFNTSFSEQCSMGVDKSDVKVIKVKDVA